MTETRESPPRSPAPGFVRPTFEQLYTSARAWLPGALRRLGVRVDAEDLLHEVVMIAYCRLDHFDPSAARRAEYDDPAHALQAWIFSIARRRVAKRHDAALRRAALPSVIGANVAHGTHDAPNVEQVAAAGERRRILVGVLAKIEPRRAEVLILYAVFDMTAPDIARQLGLKENTVKSRIIRGRREALQAIQRLPPDQRGALE